MLQNTNLLFLVSFLLIRHVFSVTYACSETGLILAVSAGGNATFNCASATTVSTTSTLQITKDIHIDGGMLLTIKYVRFFYS